DGIWLLLSAMRAEAQAQRALQAVRQAEQLATESERDAVRQRDLATAQRQEAEDARQSLRRSLYASDMQLAEEAWESGDIPRMRGRLKGQRPGRDTPGPRAFVWDYLRGLGWNPELAGLARAEPLGQLSPDGLHFVCVGMLFPPQGPDAGSKIELKLL